MGHEIIQYRDRHAIFHDLDLWAIRHFLLTEAESTKSSTLAAFIRDWEWIATGVYIGIDFDEFFHGDAHLEQGFRDLVSATVRRVKAFGSVVPLDYLDASINSPMAYHTVEQPVSRLLDRLEALRGLMVSDPPPV